MQANGMMQIGRARFTPWAMRATVLMTLLSCSAAFSYAFLTLSSRPLDGVEGQILFEASRLRNSQPLYVDPVPGAGEYGQPPTRYFVLYPPIWSWVLSWFPGWFAIIADRAISIYLWLGVLIAIAATASRPSRNAAWLAAAFIAGNYVLILYGSSGRPDGTAVCAAGVALLLSVRSERSGFIAGALFAIAAWLKPDVLGLAAGSFLATFIVERRSGALAMLGALTVSLPIASILQHTSGGTWLTHLVVSTSQPLSLAVLADNLSSRLPFFGCLIGFAAWCGFREWRRAGTWFGLVPLATSTAWTLVLLTKTGSASNYWMEPCVAALMVIAQTAPKQLGPSAAVLAMLQVICTGVATIRSSVEGIRDASSHAALLARARSICGIERADVIIADEPGLEFALNGRVIFTPYQFTHLIRRGAFPAELWRQDIERPEVRCLIMRSDLLERPLSTVDVAHDLFPPPIREVLVQRFELAIRDAGWSVYRLR